MCLRSRASTSQWSKSWSEAESSLTTEHKLELSKWMSGQKSVKEEKITESETETSKLIQKDKTQSGNV